MVSLLPVGGVNPTSLSPGAIRRKRGMIFASVCGGAMGRRVPRHGAARQTTPRAGACRTVPPAGTARPCAYGNAGCGGAGGAVRLGCGAPWEGRRRPAPWAGTSGQQTHRAEVASWGAVAVDQGKGFVVSAPHWRRTAWSDTGVAYLLAA